MRCNPPSMKSAFLLFFSQCFATSPFFHLSLTHPRWYLTYGLLRQYCGIFIVQCSDCGPMKRPFSCRLPRSVLIKMVDVCFSASLSLADSCQRISVIVCSSDALTVIAQMKKSPTKWTWLPVKPLTIPNCKACLFASSRVYCGQLRASGTALLLVGRMCWAKANTA